MSEPFKIIFFEPGMYVYWPIFILGFCGWIYMVKVSQSTFPKIKAQDKDLYSYILGRRKESWLEKGWYSPSDIGIQIRLYRAIYRREANRYLSSKSQTVFIVAARIFVLSFIVFWGLFCLFWIAVAEHIWS